MTEPDSRATIDEVYKLAKDNNRMLHAIRRDAFIGGIVKAIFWVVTLVVIPYIAWLFIQPYLDGALDTYKNVKQTANTVNATAGADLSQIQELLKKFGGGQ